MQLDKLPLITRRCGAWAVEVSLVVVSAIVPYSIGLYAQSCIGTWPCAEPGEVVPLNPVLATTEEAIAKTLARPLRENNRPVAPLTNLFWCVALVAPLAVTGWQIYLLAKTGQTSPKRWFGLRVATELGDPPGLIRAIWREGVGRWGISLSTAYLIWRYSGAFPDLGILLGLTALMLVGEGAIGLFHPQRRSLYDLLAGTWTVGDHSVTQQSAQPSVIEVQNGWTDSKAFPYQPHATVTTIVLTSSNRERRLNLWHWMRQNPGLTLLIMAIAGITSVLGTFVGTQIYIQGQANSRQSKKQNDEVFLALVKQLSNTNATVARRGAILALARLDDRRAAPFLVDLLSQEKTEGLIDTIQQALVSTGPNALPHLQKLNQSLRKDIEELRRRDAPEVQQLLQWRQRASQRAIAKILTIYNGQIHNADLSRTYLTPTPKNSAPFILVLDKTDLSGINFRSAVLIKASLRNSRFHSAGEDGRLNTFDDWLADLSGADLQEANLTGAILSQVNLTRANLTRATLNRANLQEARLTSVNLSSAKLVSADLRQAILENASLTGAELGNANFSQANLQNARLSKTSAIDAQFSLANLSKSNWQGADMTGANFFRANLQNADLSAAKLLGANLNQAKLQNANLRNVDLSAADLQGANVDGADFRGAIFVVFKPTQSDQFLQSQPQTDSITRVKGVNFAKAQNLDAKQINFICDQGGLHPRCR